MRNICKNIIFLSLIITILFFASCNKSQRSFCEGILNFSYSENDTILKNNTNLIEDCAKKYHKQPDFFQKISQIYYYNAIDDFTSEGEILVKRLQPSAYKLFKALENINLYFSKIEQIKFYDYEFRGEIYERLGDIYKEINSLKFASALYDKALTDYEIANNEKKYLNVLIKIGKLYQYNHIPNIAMIYFEMAEENDNIPNDIYRKIIDNKIITLYELNDYNKADSIFINHFNTKIQDYDYHSVMGNRYFYDRDYTNALPHLHYCFENGNSQESLAFSEKLAEAYFNIDDHDNEMIFIQYQAKYNSIEIRKTPVKLDLEKLYDINFHLIENKEVNNTYNHIPIIISIVSFLIIICLFVLFGKDKKNSQEKIRVAQQAIDNNNATIKSKDKIINDISKELVDLKPNEDFEMAYGRFCNSNIYKKIKLSFEGVTILTKNVQDYNNLQLSNKDVVTITKTFTTCFPKAIPSMKKDFEGITTSDIKFIILLFMNLNNVEIAVLLGLTYGATNKRSNKIKNVFKTKDDLSQFLLTYIKSTF